MICSCCKLSICLKLPLFSENDERRFHSSPNQDVRRLLQAAQAHVLSHKKELHQHRQGHLRRPAIRLCDLVIKLEDEASVVHFARLYAVEQHISVYLKMYPCSCLTCKDEGKLMYEAAVKYNRTTQAPKQ